MRGMRALRRLANPIVGRRARRRVSAAALRALAAKRGRYDELCAVASAEVLAPAAARELSELGEILACQEAWEAKLLPRDAVDDAPACLVEVKAAAGGDEASLFAGDLLAMYERFAGRRRHGWDLLSVTKSDCGGVSHAYAEVKGPGAYGALRFESGVHRVQRVPRNDVRIHTSTASVVVFPAGAEDRGATVDFDPAELRIDTFRASGAGGQHATTRVQIFNPTSMRACSRAAWSARKPPRGGAVRVARSSRAAATARRIRTYNAPHDRVTDHRSGFTANSVDRVLRGDLRRRVASSRPRTATRMVEFEESSVIFFFGFIE
ncbi:translation release factor [Aureococcus anophagefferens]|nr:translation release factor [Aureococcus anophagefferens]